MKPKTTVAIGIAAAFFLAACVMFEDRIARVTSPEIAAAAITASCTGGRDFITAATATLDDTTAALIAKGVEAACALRTERKTISATVYDAPLDSFCAETSPLRSDEANDQTRAAFNTSRAQICEARP